MTRELKLLIAITGLCYVRFLAPALQVFNKMADVSLLISVQWRGVASTPRNCAPVHGQLANFQFVKHSIGYTRVGTQCKEKSVGGKGTVIEVLESVHL